MTSSADAELVALIERARTGDGRAFEDLARREERAHYRHAARMVGPAPDAEDVVQDAFLSAWKSILSFEGTSFRAWLFRIVTNRALDRIRSRKRRAELPLEPSDDDEVTVGGNPPPRAPPRPAQAGDAGGGRVGHPRRDRTRADRLRRVARGPRDRRRGASSCARGA